MLPKLGSKWFFWSCASLIATIVVLRLWLDAGAAAALPAATDALPVVQVTTHEAEDSLPTLVETANSRLLAVFARYGALGSRISTDGGATWGGEMQIDGCCRYNPSLARAADGTVWLAYVRQTVIEIEPDKIQEKREIWHRTSTDGGATWTAERQISTGSTNDDDPAILETAGGVLWVVWQSGRSGNGDLWYKTSSDRGVTWSADVRLTSSDLSDSSATLAQAADGRIVVAWNRGEGALLQRSSADGGLTWSVERQIAPCCRRSPSLAAAGGSLWLAYEQDEDIWLRKSADNGATWSTEARFTHFVAYDGSASLAALAAGRPGLAWSSARSGSRDIWYGSPGEREDDNPPPYVDSMGHGPECNLDSHTVITLRATARDETGVVAVHLVWEVNGVAQPDLALFDDGMHEDEAAGDGTWGVRLGPLAAGSQVSYRVRATDTDGNTYLYPHANSFSVLPVFAKTANILFVADGGISGTDSLSERYTAALDRLGYAYDIWEIGRRCALDSTSLSQYAGGTVIWAVPYEGRLINEESQLAAVQGYLDAGGKLFVTGQNIAQRLSGSANARFLTDYLHATFRQDDSQLYGVAGASGDPIGDGLVLNLSASDGVINQYSKDVIDPIAPAQIAFTYKTGASAAQAGPIRAGEAAAAGLAQPALTPIPAPPASPAPTPTARPAPTAAPTPPPVACPGPCGAGLHVDTGTYRVAYLAFGFEGINNATDRAAVMERVLAWLQGRAPRLILLTPARNQPAAAGPIRFTWLAAPGATSYHLQIDTTPAFDSPGLINERVPSATFTRSLTPGAYYWRVRALYPSGWGDWTAAWPLSVAASVTPVTTDPADDAAPALVQTADGGLLAVLVRNGTLWSASSTDGGATWGGEALIAGCCRYNPSLARLADGTLWLAYDRAGDVWRRTSPDYGATWSAEQRLTTDPAGDTDPVILQAADGKLWAVWQSNRTAYYYSSLWYKTSADGGATWSGDLQLTRDAQDTEPAIAQADDGRLVVTWYRYGALWQLSGADEWSPERQIGSSGRRPSLVTAGNDLWLAFDWAGDIWYRISQDRGETWTEPLQFTRFMGDDAAPAVAALGAGGVGIAWGSDRSGNPDIWFGRPGAQDDLDPPPYVAMGEHRPWPNPDSDDAITFRAYAQDETGVVSMRVKWTLDGVSQADLPMADDGAHGDGSARDGMWGVQHAPLEAGREVTYRACATDASGHSACYQQNQFFTVQPAFVKTANILFVADGGGYNAPYAPYGTAWYRPYYAQALAALGYRHDTWDVLLRGDPGSATLDQYRRGIVIWAAPYWGRVTDPGSDSIGQLRAYLDAGGRLFISGQNIAASLAQRYDGGLLEDYLHATLRQDDTGLFGLAGAPGDPIGDGLALNISGGDGANDQYSKDEIDPIAPAEVVFTYRADVSAMLAEPAAPRKGDGPQQAEAGKASSPAANVGSGTAALRVDTGKYQAVFFAFGFEAINSAADRTAVMARVLDWLGVSATNTLYLPLVVAASGDSFWADRDRLELGECTSIHWAATGAQAVYLNGEGVPGQGTRQVCPMETTTYVLTVVRATATRELPLTIEVVDTGGS